MFIARSLTYASRSGGVHLSLSQALFGIWPSFSVAHMALLPSAKDVLRTLAINISPRWGEESSCVPTQRLNQPITQIR